jgi:hypothetical protein
VTVSIEQSLDREKALSLLKAFPRSTFFHTPIWLEVLVRAFTAFSGGWITEREGSELVGFMPYIEIRKGPFRNLWAMPFGTYGDPIASSRPTAYRLIERFFEMSSRPGCRRAGASLLCTDVSSGLPPGVNRQTEECRIIELEGTFDEYRSRIVSKKRRQLHNRSQRAGVRIEMIDSRDGFMALYYAYRRGSKDWGGVHPYPLSLFEELFASRDEGVVFWGAVLDDEFLGGHIDLYFGGVAQAWQAGLTERASEFDISSMLVFSAVEEAYRRGMSEFNLGSSGRHSGIRFFKESLGGREYLYSTLTAEKGWSRFLGGR